MIYSSRLFIWIFNWFICSRLFCCYLLFYLYIFLIFSSNFSFIEKVSFSYLFFYLLFLIVNLSLSIIPGNVIALTSTTGTSAFTHNSFSRELYCSISFWIDSFYFCSLEDITDNSFNASLSLLFYLFSSWFCLDRLVSSSLKLSIVYYKSLNLSVSNLLDSLYPF